MCVWPTALKFGSRTVLSLPIYDRQFQLNSSLINNVMPLQSCTIGCVYKTPFYKSGDIYLLKIDCTIRGFWSCIYLDNMHIVLHPQANYFQSLIGAALYMRLGLRRPVLSTCKISPNFETLSMIKGSWYLLLTDIDAVPLYSLVSSL